MSGSAPNHRFKYKKHPVPLRRDTGPVIALDSPVTDVQLDTLMMSLRIAIQEQNVTNVVSSTILDGCNALIDQFKATPQRGNFTDLAALFNGTNLPDVLQKAHDQRFGENSLADIAFGGSSRMDRFIQPIQQVVATFVAKQTKGLTTGSAGAAIA